MSESAATKLSGTGSFRVLEIRDRLVAAAQAQGGKSEAPAGKPLPVETPKPDLARVAEQLNISARSIGRDLRFEVNLESGRSVIQVLDRETGEIIRQIPPEKVTPYLKENGTLEVRLYDDVV